MPRPETGRLRATRPRRAEPDLQREAFARSVIRGLDDTPRWLSCRYLYDREGSGIFERITEQQEYYPTRTEDGILAREATRIRELCGDTTLVELGAGSATKTRHLLRAWTARRRRARYVPVDISRAMLAETAAALAREFPTLDVRPLAGSYEQALPLLGRASPLTLAFLGSSVGNFNEDETGEFLGLVAASLGPGDRFLLGIDLAKDAATLEAAYNDRAGWSAAFTLNLFERMNRELGAAVDTAGLEHVATWNEALSRIEIRARARRDVAIDLREWGRSYRLAAGESVLVEISRKFHVDATVRALSAHGFSHLETFHDPARLFALLLLEYRGPLDPVAATRQRLARELEEQRGLTLRMVAPLDDAGASRQHSPILSPVVWDLGHVAGYEREWISRASLPARRRAGTPPADAGFYDPIRHPRSVRGSLPLAGREACARELSAVREATLARLQETAFDPGDPLLDGGYVFSMVAQHEAQHSETILQGIALMPGLRYEPAHRGDPRAGRGLAGEVFVPGGAFPMGTDDTASAYDNERPSHVVEVDSFWIDVAPVTSGQWLDFLDDGGYRRRELWTAAGWQWLADARVECPLGWRFDDDEGWQQTSFGRVTPVDRERPVVHVSWYEASAFAAWCGKRLPTEAEWEKAAAWDLERAVPRRYPWGDAPPDRDRANLGQWSFAPSGVGAYPRGASYFGCEQMLGDVWEWTASDFLPYPGFRAFPYPEYSAVHFGARHKVLRGGSWATPAIAMRNTFRNWDLPIRRQIFAGLRCARD